MRPIQYFTIYTLCLSLEDYWNAGLDREKARQLIEGIPDPGSSTLNLRCSPSGLNGNWRVSTSCADSSVHEWLVDRIQWVLDDELLRIANLPPPIEVNTTPQQPPDTRGSP